MPPRKAHKGAPAADPASGSDRIGALPDALLHHVLSFLLARDAVRTCVLARRWLDLWKSAIGLRIVGADGTEPAPFEEVQEFVDHLLLLRGCLPLDTFELRVSGVAVDERRVRLWIRYAVMCKVRVLRLSVFGGGRARLRLEDPSLLSRHLIRLELRGLALEDHLLNFSSCLSLQDLRIHKCGIVAERISSQSLKHLRVTKGFFSPNFRTRIDAPNLVSLDLQICFGRTPVLDRMPLLVSASVAILSLFSDCCSLSEYGDCGDDSCEGCIQDDSSCVLPQSISKVSTLELLAVTEIMFIFRRDLKWCPTFGGLKTLVLNEHWWVPDVRALSCILEHAPVLGKLRLCIVSKGLELNVKMKGCFNQKELPSTISAPLKRVVVRCAILDERVLKLLKFLSKLNICFRF